MKKKYVLGFLFNEKFDEVCLIRKNRPEWQKGFLNGIGGKVESGETYHDSMCREFFEETGVILYDWKEIGIMEGEEWIVRVFTHHSFTIDSVETKTDEEIVTVKISDLNSMRDQLISNIPWLIHMCIDFHLQNSFKKFKINY